MSRAAKPNSPSGTALGGIGRLGSSTGGCRRGVLMATEDEIRARVEAADQARIRVRADIAAKIATLVAKREQLREELSETENLLAAALVESDSVMTRAELSSFTGVEDTDL